MLASTFTDIGNIIVDCISASAAIAIVVVYVKSLRKPKQYTYLYCPHCGNELVGDAETTYVDPRIWTSKNLDPDALVDEWHHHMVHGPSLAEYLGLTWEQYKLWAEYPPLNEWEVTYRCGTCKGFSAWDFDHYLEPILTRDEISRDNFAIINEVRVEDS